MSDLHSKKSRARKPISVALSLFIFLVMLPLTSSIPVVTRAKGVGATAQDPGPQLPNIVVIPPGSAYRQTNFISDIPGLAPVLDPLLVNPWGISATASSPFWIANNGTSTTQLIRGDQPAGSPVVLNASPQTITIPGGLPTGTVANPVATDFVLPGACAAPPCGANFLFASINGNITGWDPNAPAAGSTTAVIGASQPGRVYTGLAYGSNGGGNRIYAADFANGNIDVYTPTFGLTTVSGNFADPTIPTTMGNTFHPHNIQAIGSGLYVTYAKVGAGGFNEDGVGNGFVRRFNTDGVRDLTFGINNGALNSPWGIALAPASFGVFGGALLIGNFGRGNPSVHAYNATTGAFLGTIQNEGGEGIVIDGLWALQVGNGGNGGDVNTVYFTAGLGGSEEHGLFGSLNPTAASATSLIQFATDDFVISEGSGHIDITVTRAGDASGTATVNFNTYDQSQPGHASQKSDYEIALGKVTFAAGETSKTVRILIVNDVFVEDNETIDLALSNPTGTLVGMGSPNVATLTILDNDAIAPTTNPIDDANFFVRQHYLDFLNREPDTAGFTFWVNQITSCGADAACIDLKRANVSAAFFLSIEFQKTGVLAYLTNMAAFGNMPSSPGVPVFYGTFERDVQSLQKDFVFGQAGADAQLEANTLAYFSGFVARPEFVFKYPTTQTPAVFVDALFTNAAIVPSAAQRQAAIDEFAGAGDTTDQAARARALRRVAENTAFSQAQFNRAFVLMEYFGYLRRDPDSSGYNFWLNKLNAAGGNFINSDMVKGFLVSSEYRQRFGAN